MDKYTENMLKYEIEQMEIAESIEIYKESKGRAEGIVLGCLWSKSITKDEATEADKWIKEASEKYWNKTEADYRSAHRRIFPKK